MAPERSSDYLAQHGLLYERVDRDRCVELEPALADTGPRWPARLYFARDEVGDCNKFTQGLAAACAARGVQLPVRHERQRIETSGGRVSGVVTDKGRIAADHRRGRHGQLHGAAAAPSSASACRSIR